MGLTQAELHIRSDLRKSAKRELCYNDTEGSNCPQDLHGQSDLAQSTVDSIRYSGYPPVFAQCHRSSYKKPLACPGQKDVMPTNRAVILFRRYVRPNTEATHNHVSGCDRRGRRTRRGLCLDGGVCGHRLDPLFRDKPDTNKGTLQ